MIQAALKHPRFWLAVCGFLLTTVFLVEARAVPGKELAVSSQNAPENAAGGASSPDETSEFKHSPSVRLLSRVTGLSLDSAYWLAVGLNFAIVVGAIAWISKKKLPQAFRNRTSSIQKSLEEARRSSEDANRRLQEIESRLAQLDEEIARMRGISEREAASEEGRARAGATEEARRILETAEQEIAAAVKAARRELTSYVADLAVSLAAKQIRVDVPTDEVLVRQFTRQLPPNGSEGKKA